MKMETNEIKNLEQLKRLTSLYFKTLKPANDQSNTNIAALKFMNYSELGYVIVDMLRLCILALNQEANKISQTNKNAIDVALILEQIVQLIPLNEMEFLSEIDLLCNEDSNC
jgi:hypothetical protein